MKLMIVIVQQDDAHILTQNLTKSNILCTKISSKGGFLRHGNTTLLIGVDDLLVDSVMNTIRESCKRRKTVLYSSTGIDSMNNLSIPQGVEVEVGGANVFVVDMNHLIKI